MNLKTAKIRILDLDLKGCVYLNHFSHSHAVANFQRRTDSKTKHIRRDNRYKYPQRKHAFGLLRVRVLFVPQKRAFQEERLSHVQKPASGHG